MTDVLPDQVVIVSDFATVQGGASKLALLQAQLLAERGVPVTVISGDAEFDALEGVNIVALGGRKLLEEGKLSAAINGLWNRKNQSVLRNWIEKNDTPATIYHVHGYHQTLSPSVLAPLAKVKKRTVMHAHDYFLACPNGAFFDFNSGTSCDRQALSASCVLRNCDKRNYGHKGWRVLRQALQNRSRAHLLPDVTTILLHEGMERWLFRREPRGQIKVLANPADPMLALPTRAETNQDVVYIGDIHAYKGVFVLAEAGRHTGISVRFIGDGRDRVTLGEEYPEHRYDGWQNQEGVRQAIADARLLVAPTLGPEPFGLAPVEALMSGVPVVMSDSMLLSRDIVERGVGACFKAANVGSLAQVLNDLTSDDAAVAAMSRAAKYEGRQISMSSEDWCTALVEIYDALLS